MEEHKMAQEIKGIIGSTEGSTNEDPNGRWKKRVSFQIGDTMMGAFDEGADEVTAVPDGTEVKLQYTESKDGKYKNLVKGSIEVLGQGEAPVTEQETIEVASTDNSNKDFNTVTDYKDQECDKFDLGMAKNGAMNYVSRKLAGGKVWDETADKAYKALVKRIFRINKELRKELL